MSSDWPTVQIDQVCDLIVDCVNKTAPVVDEPTLFRMIRTTNIRNGRIDLARCRFVDEDTYVKWTRRAALQFGDVLLTREAPIGEVGFVLEPKGHFLGQRVMQYRADVTVLSPRFLLYTFLSPALQHQFDSHEGSGSVVSHIRVGDCFKFKITLPPLPVQSAIASLLGALDDRIALLRETNATLEAIAQALFKSWFVDFDPVHAKQQGIAPAGMDEATAALFPDGFDESALGLVPTGWRASKLGAETNYLNRGISPKYVEAGGVLVINQKCVRDFKIDFRKARRHDDAQRTVKGRELRLGDVLVNSTGVGTLGRVAQVLNLDELTIVDSHVTVVRAGDRVSWNYLGLAVMRKQAEIEELGEGTTGQTELNRAKLASLSLVVPPEALQQVFDASTISLRIRMSANLQQAQTLTTLRDTLLPRLISGQLRLPQAEIELTEALA